MRRAIVIAVAVAILGLSAHSLSTSNSPSQVAGTSSANNGASSNGAATQPTTSQSVSYENGTFNGNTSQTIYGPVQVAAVISGGKISDVQFLQMPSDQAHSREVTAFAEPPLKQETLAAQSSNIDFVSGATQTSEGYQQSLQSALDQATMNSSGA